MINRKRHNIGPLTDEETDYLILEYKKGRAVNSISEEMVRPPKFIYRQLESLGLVFPKSSGIIMCRKCGKLEKVKSRRVKWCSDCAKDRHTKQLKEHRANYLANDPIALNKMRARTMANWWLTSGRLTRPDRCELCNQTPVPMKDGRTGLRMDHYMGYEPEYWTTVRFVCIPCDSKQIIERNKSITLSLEIVN